MEEIISKQLKRYPIFKKKARHSYYSDKLLEQIHLDHFFWQPSGVLNAGKTPVLVICDVATRFRLYFVQTRKNDSLKKCLKTFVKKIKKQFKNSIPANECLVITDGAKELAIDEEILGIRFKSQISKGINKAVLAEVAIRQARGSLRDFELKLNLKNISSGTKYRIDESNLQEILDIIQDQANLKAKFKKKKEHVDYRKPEFRLGTPVFAINLYKYAPHAMKATLLKKGYLQNYFYEPFYISKLFYHQGIYRYCIASYEDNRDIKYKFYADELQKIDSKHASEYINKWLKNAAKIANSEEP